MFNGGNSKYVELRTRCVNFVVSIISLLRTVKDKDVKFSLESQLIRSASSIGANLVEGNGAPTKKDWLNYMNISRKSALETEYWLEIFQRACEVYDEKLMNIVLKESAELIMIFTKITKTGASRYGKNNKQ